MNAINTKRNPSENKDASIKSKDDPFKKILAKLEQKDEDIHDLKLKILSQRDQVKGGNNSHIGQTHNILHKVKIDLPSSMAKIFEMRFDGSTKSKNILKCTISMATMKK